VTEISEIALTTEFWFVAVFIGLLINIVSSIIQRIASKGFFRLNKSWDEKNIKSKQTRQFLVDKYSSSYQQLYLGKLEQNAKQMDVINHTTRQLLFCFSEWWAHLVMPLPLLRCFQPLPL
jgi:hypothetical protein